MQALPVRLEPGDDLRGALEALCRTHFPGGAFVLCGIGSLDDPRLRLAADPEDRRLDGPHEIITLSGTVTVQGAHLHASLASTTGAVVAGHVARGCVIRTTAEVLLCRLEEWSLTRVQDSRTGYLELVCQPKDDAPGRA